ncbi:MAG: HAMP domain-containing sensor histidine kinase [Chitinophagaceae bacterium]
MPVRLRITLLFATLVVLIVGLVCGNVYYFSYSARINTIKTRLVNRAKTTAKLLNQREIFDQQLVRRIDSATTLSLKKKSVEAYDYRNRKMYSYSDMPGDTLTIGAQLLNEARKKSPLFLELGTKEAVIFFYEDKLNGIVVASAAEDTEGKQELSALFDILLISFLTSILLVVGIGFIFSTRLLRPIKVITADIEEISAQNLARRIATGPSKDEWHGLANTLNDLLNRLQDSFQLQSRFIANASHELSTPLTSISSQLEVALQRERLAADYKSVLESVYHDVRHMNKLTQTLLEFAKASGNPGGLEITMVRVDEILLELPAQIAKLNAGYSVSLQFGKLPDQEAYLIVYGNQPLLSTAIGNIMLNACKYSGDHKALVTLEIADRIRIDIIDSGPGIPEEELHNIFQPFYRIQEELSKSKGFGLGLSLAERIIKLHKGSISVESGHSTGTRFIISLPLLNNVP